MQPDETFWLTYNPGRLDFEKGDRAFSCSIVSHQFWTSYGNIIKESKCTIYIYSQEENRDRFAS